MCVGYILKLLPLVNNKNYLFNFLIFVYIYLFIHLFIFVLFNRFRGDSWNLCSIFGTVAEY